MNDILRKQKRIHEILHPLKTNWGVLAILFMVTVFFSLVIGMYLTFESSYLQGQAVKIMSYLEFSESNL